MNFDYKNDENDCIIVKSCYEKMPLKKEILNSCYSFKTVKKNVSESTNTLLKKIVDCGSIMAEMKEEELLIPNIRKYHYPYDFLEDYIFQKNFDEKVFTKEGLDRRRKNQMKSQKNLKKLDVYRLAFMAKMNKTKTL